MALIRSSQWALASAFVYSIASLVYALHWEYAHDEGVTWDQAIGSPNLELGAPAVPIDTLYSAVDGSSTRAPGKVVERLLAADGMHPPAYYVALSRWAAVAGTTRLARLLPVVAIGILGLVALRRVARRTVGEREADAVMFLAAVSPWFVGYTVLARPYFVCLCFSIAATAIAFEIHDGSRKTVASVLFAAVSALGLYTIYHYAFVVGWHLLFLLVSATRREPGERFREVLRVAVVSTAIALAFAPWVPSLLHHLGETRGVRYFGNALSPDQWPGAVWNLATTFALAEATRLPRPALLLNALLLLSVVTLPLAARFFLRSIRGEEGRRIFWLSAPALPLLVAGADALHGTSTIAVSKTVFGLFPLLLMAVVGACGTLERRAFRLGGITAWTALFAVALGSTLAQRIDFATPYERVASFLVGRDGESHLIVVNTLERGYMIPLLLTLRDTGLRDSGIVLADRESVARRIGAALRGGDLEQITLVNLSAYHHPAVLWGEADLIAVAKRARQHGFRVHTVRPSGLKTLPKQARQLVIATPVEVNFWAM